MSKKQEKGRKMAQSANVVSILADMLGGEGWDDPRLVDVVRKWGGDDPTMSAHAIADVLVEQSFDPRDLLDSEV